MNIEEHYNYFDGPGPTQGGEHFSLYPHHEELCFLPQVKWCTSSSIDSLVMLITLFYMHNQFHKTPRCSSIVVQDLHYTTWDNSIALREMW